MHVIQIRHTNLIIHKESSITGVMIKKIVIWSRMAWTDNDKMNQFFQKHLSHFDDICVISVYTVLIQFVQKQHLRLSF
jgi:hypothetical protein